MSSLTLADRQGNETRMDVDAGQPIRDALLAHSVPPASVVVRCDGEVVSAWSPVEAGREYRATLVEGYDLERMRRLYRGSDDPSFYSYRRLSFEDGVDVRRDELDADEFVRYVERRVAETLRTHDVYEPGATVLLALSGGIDSATLLEVLDSIRDDVPPFDLRSVTVEEFASPGRSESIDYAHELADEYDVAHRSVDAEQIRDVYGLNADPTTVFEELSRTAYGGRLSRVVDGVNRRLFELTAETVGADTILIGAHRTELIAGLLRAGTVGREARPQTVIRREHGSLAYAHPLAYLSKQDIWLYHDRRRPPYENAVAFEPWDQIPAKQSFFYYLADLVQTFWPGIEHWLYTAHNRRRADDETPPLSTCANCRKRFDGPTERGPESLCHVCSIFETHGYLD